METIKKKMCPQKKKEKMQLDVEVSPPANFNGFSSPFTKPKLFSFGKKIMGGLAPVTFFSSPNLGQVTDRMNMMHIRPLCMHTDGLNEISSQTNEVITGSCQLMFT